MTTLLGQEPIEDAKAEPDDIRLWSVTTIIDVLDKPAIAYWSAEEAAVAAINQQSTWRGMLADCDDDCDHTSAQRCAAVKWLRDARNRRSKNRLSSTALGTAMHDLCEQYALSGSRPNKDNIEAVVTKLGGTAVTISNEGPVLWRMLDRFDEWLQRFTPEYQATEVTVYHPDYGYAGTADGFLTIDGVRSIIDYKTSRDPLDSRGNPKKPYSEVSLQLAAYRHAMFAAVWRPRRNKSYQRRYYLLSQAERDMAQPVPEVDGGLCVFITPERCEAHPVRCGDTVFHYFLNIQEAKRWSADADALIGSPIQEATP